YFENTPAARQEKDRNPCHGQRAIGACPPHFGGRHESLDVPAHEACGGLSVAGRLIVLAFDGTTGQAVARFRHMVLIHGGLHAERFLRNWNSLPFAMPITVATIGFAWPPQAVASAASPPRIRQPFRLRPFPG